MAATGFPEVVAGVDDCIDLEAAVEVAVRTGLAVVLDDCIDPEAAAEAVGHMGLATAAAVAGHIDQVVAAEAEGPALDCKHLIASSEIVHTVVAEVVAAVAVSGNKVGIRREVGCHNWEFESTAGLGRLGNEGPSSGRRGLEDCGARAE